MISTILIPELMQRFPDLTFEQNEPPAPIVTIRAAHPPVGDVSIYDYEGEAVVEIKNFTHSHFDPYDPSLSETQRERIIMEQILDFLADLFNDQILFWVRQDGQAGGWKHLEHLDEPGSSANTWEEGTYYVWSGRVDLNRFCE